MGSHECDVRNAQLQELNQRLNEEASEQNTRTVELRGSCDQLEGKYNELSKLQSDGFQSQSKNIESEHEARKQALQDMDAMLRTLINESVGHESNERGMQLQEMVRKLQDLLNTEEVERNKQFQELVSLLRDLDASHTDLSSRHSDGHAMHTDNHSQLEFRLKELEARHVDGHNMHTENLEAERRQRAQELENHAALLKQIEQLVGQENTERNVQVQDLMRRLDSHQDMNQNAFDVERKTTDEQIANVQNAMQNLARQTAEERQVRGDAIEAVTKGSEGLKQEMGAKLANLKEEFSREDELTRQQLAQLAANTREQMVQLTDGAKEDTAKRVAIWQGSVSGLQNALEQDRMAFREAREEQMRNMQSEREARTRQNAEIRADYKREIMKEHQDRMDHVADLRKDIYKSLRGETGQGASHDPSLEAVDGPNLGPGQGSDKGSGPQFASMDGLSELDKKHTINSLGQRLSQMERISPKPTFRTPQLAP